MWIVFEVSGGFIIIMLLLVLAGIDILFENLSAICYALVTFCLFAVGIYTAVRLDKEKAITGKIARVLRGILISTSTFYSMALIETGCGALSIEKAVYPLFEFLHTQKLDEFYNALVVAVIVCFAVCIPGWIGKIFENNRLLSEISGLVSGLAVVAVCIGGIAIAVADAKTNSLTTIDVDREKYELMSDADVYVETSYIMDSILLKNGTIKAGTKVYESRKVGKYEGEDGEYYCLISDGKNITGYVKEEVLKSLYEIGQ